MQTGSDTDSQRLFFALRPTSALQVRLAALVPPLGARHVAPDNLHLTLAFLGSVDAATRHCLESRADALRIDRFELTLDRLGCFRRHGLLWAGASQLPASLSRLVDALRNAQHACGQVPETRAFQAHVTLVRNLRRCPPERAIDPLVWNVDQFVLVRSELSTRGARYEVVRSWELA